MYGFLKAASGGAPSACPPRVETLPASRFTDLQKALLTNPGKPKSLEKTLFDLEEARAARKKSAKINDKAHRDFVRGVGASKGLDQSEVESDNADSDEERGRKDRIEAAAAHLKARQRAEELKTGKRGLDDDAEEDGGEWCDVVDVGLFNESRG